MRKRSQCLEPQMRDKERDGKGFHVGIKVKKCQNIKKNILEGESSTTVNSNNCM
jgi:hypothetical protein